MQQLRFFYGHWLLGLIAFADVFLDGINSLCQCAAVNKVYMLRMSVVHSGLALALGGLGHLPRR